MNIEIIFFSVVGILVLAAAGYFLLVFLKGSIKIQLPKISYVPGDVVKGTVRLHAKQIIEANEFIVCLVAKQVTKTRDSDGKRTTQESEIYRDGILLEGPMQYSKNSIKDYFFELKMPDSDNPVMVKPKAPQSIALDLVKLFVGRGECQLVWSVEASLDAKGVDLFSTKRIYLK